jgi:hypothetical protein
MRKFKRLQILYHINIRMENKRVWQRCMLYILIFLSIINNKGREILSQLDATYNIYGTDYGTNY